MHPAAATTHCSRVEQHLVSHSDHNRSWVRHSPREPTCPSGRGPVSSSGEGVGGNGHGAQGQARQGQAGRG
ncbi:predicted protein [Streptomyces sp. AA4]|nr:predicted protein [Streptomyces sp. AA4]